MPIIPKVSPTGRYELDGALLNALIDAANAWNNLTVELIVSSEDVTRLIRSPAGAKLRVVVPPSSGGSLPAGGTDGQVLVKQSNTDGDADWEDPTGLPSGVVWEEFTICEDGTPATRWIPTSTTDPSA